VNPRGHGGEGHPAPDPGRTLAEELGETADELRQLYTDAGLRPYRVFAVLLRWSGGAKGRGTPRVVREREILPTPWVDLRPLREDDRPAGEVVRGRARLRQVSPQYTEAEVRGIFGGEREGDEVIVEVVHDARDGYEPTRRRFAVEDVPWRNAGGFEWVVALSPEDDGRSPSGAPDVAELVPGRGRR
jgi:hypothetical protein